MADRVTDQLQPYLPPLASQTCAQSNDVFMHTHPPYGQASVMALAPWRGFVELVALPGGPHPIPFRTRSLSPPGPMVLRLKARESRSPPALLTLIHIDERAPKITNPSLTTNTRAGWSSPVARQAHNLKVTGSNPVPAPNATILGPPNSGPSSVSTQTSNSPRLGFAVTTTELIRARKASRAAAISIVSGWASTSPSRSTNCR